MSEENIYGMRFQPHVVLAYRFRRDQVRPADVNEQVIRLAQHIARSRKFMVGVGTRDEGDGFYWVCFNTRLIMKPFELWVEDLGRGRAVKPAVRRAFSLPDSNLLSPLLPEHKGMLAEYREHQRHLAAYEAERLAEEARLARRQALIGKLTFAGLRGRRRRSKGEE